MSDTPLPLPELSEPDVVRHFVNLSTRNFSVDTHFYPLGSCTMKYNPKRNERLAALPGMAELHPYQPESTLQGMLALLHMAQHNLAEIAGLPAVSLQPAAGAHGEMTAMLVAAAYFRDLGQKRTTVLIPDAAHGTNPASAAMAGFKIVSVKSRPDGFVDIDDLAAKLERPDGRVHDYQSEHARAVRAADRADRQDDPRRRRTGLSRRGQHERHPGRHAAGRFRRRPDALQPAQDLQRPARRRRTRRGPDRRGRAAGRRSCPCPSWSRTAAATTSITIGRSRSAGCGASSAASACWCACTATSARTGRKGCGGSPRTRC